MNVKNGLYLEKTINGEIKSSAYYKNGKLHGKYKEYDINTGLLILSETYENGKKNGTSFFYKNGNLKFKINYKNGVRDGLAIYLYDNGNLQKIEKYKNDKKEGQSIIWRENGLIKSNFLYKNDKINGLGIIFYSNGNIKNKINYKNNLIHGIFEKFYENGKIEEKISYENGEKNGVSLKFHRNGNLKEFSVYKNNKLHGLFLEIDENKNILSLKKYEDGKIFKDSSKKEHQEELKKETEKDDYLKILIKNTSWGKLDGNTVEEDWGNKILEDKISSLEYEK